METSGGGGGATWVIFTQYVQPASLCCILWPIIDPIFVPFEQDRNEREPFIKIR